MQSPYHRGYVVFGGNADDPGLDCVRHRETPIETKLRSCMLVGLLSTFAPGTKDSTTGILLTGSECRSAVQHATALRDDPE